MGKLCQTQFPVRFFSWDALCPRKKRTSFSLWCVNGNSNASFYTMRVIASPTTTFCLVKPVSVPGVRPETTLNNYIPPSLKRLLERFTICIRLCDEDVRTITGGTQWAQVVFYSLIPGYFHEQNAIPVSAAFVATSKQPFALSQPGKTNTNYPSFTPMWLDISWSRRHTRECCGR